LGIYFIDFRNNDVTNNQNSALAAAFTSYEGGQVSMEVTFFDDGGNEIPNIISIPSTDITVRLKYANTGGLQASSASITSTLPAGFSYVPGTLRNVYNETISIPLQDTRFSGQTLTVSPSAGLYNFSDDDASGILDIGKADFLRVQKCSVASGDDELFSAGINDQTQASNNSVGNTCSTYVAGSFLSGLSIPLINQRYLKSIECQPTSGINETFAQTSSNASATSGTDPTGNICITALTGSTFISVADIDLLSGRYARVLRCDHPTNDDEFLLAPQLYDTDIASGDATGENCAAAYPGSSFLSGNNIDLRDETNSEGYIEFQVTTPATDGCYDISGSLNSPDFTNITDTNTCGVRVQSGSVIGNGEITFSKTYFDGVNNINSATLPLGGQIRVRLNYNNTSSDIAYGMNIDDSYNTTAFEYLAGTAMQCYFSADCVALDDSTFSTGLVSVGPNAGIFANPATDTVTPIEPGRERYLHIVQCFNGTEYDTFVAEADSDPLTVTGTCADYGLVGYTKTGSRSVDIAGKRYLNMMTCENGGFYDSFVAEASNTPGESASLCTDYGLTGYTNVTSFDVDLQASTELNLKRCDLTGVKDTYVSEASGTAGASGSGCFDAGTTGYSDDGGLGVTTGNTANGYGYIEYILRVQDTISLGTYGTIGTLAQNGSNVGGTVVATPVCPTGTELLQSDGYCLPDVVDAFSYRYCGTAGGDDPAATNQWFYAFDDCRNAPNIVDDIPLTATAEVVYLGSGIGYIDVTNDDNDPHGEKYVSQQTGTTLENENFLKFTACYNQNDAQLYRRVGVVADGTNVFPSSTGCPNVGTGGNYRRYYGFDGTYLTDTDPGAEPGVSLLIKEANAQDVGIQLALCPTGYTLVANECILGGEEVLTITADSSTTLTVQLFCDSIVPATGVRNITLSDAELRTDQDFTCNYDAAICPVVFEDANLNAQKDETENIYDAITVELRRASDNSLVGTILTDTNAVGLQCFEDLASGVFYDVIVTNPPTTFSTTGPDTLQVEASVLVLEQPTYFGYSDGGVLLDATPEVFFPGLTISPQDVLVSTVIPFVEVRDLRSANLPWTVSGVVTDFNGTINPSNTLPIGNRFTTIPQTITAASGDSQIITRGSEYTVTSTIDPTDIFSTGSNDGNGQYSISVDIEYNVPAYSTNDAYQSTVTFTLI
jgi:hypothetical protein